MENTLKPFMNDAHFMHQSTTAKSVSKKASAMSILCSVELALISPANTTFMEMENPEILLNYVQKTLSSLDSTSAQPSKRNGQRVGKLTKKIVAYFLCLNR